MSLNDVQKMLGRSTKVYGYNGGTFYAKPLETRQTGGESFLIYLDDEGFHNSIDILEIERIEETWIVY